MLSLNDNEFDKNENGETVPDEVNETVENTAPTENDNLAKNADDVSLSKKEQKRQAKKAKKLPKKGSFKNSFKTRSSKAGTYMFIMCAIALAAVILLNMIVGKLPASVKSIDTTKTDLYSIGDYSKKIAEGINEQVTIYLVATKGNEDAMLLTLLERYASLNDNIKVDQKDPELNQLSGDSEISENSLMFVSDKRSKTVDYNSLYEYSEEAQQQYYYGSQVSPDIFDGENEITSALSYVTTDILPKVYELTGHGETALSDNVVSSVADENIEITDLDLLKAKAVPDDCECLIISSPASDFSADEKSMVVSYLEAGGNIFVMTTYSEAKTPNLDALLESYGLQRQDGVVLEGNENNYYSNVVTLIPEIQSHEITDPITESGYAVLIPYAQSIVETASHRSTLELTSLLKTSGSAFTKDDISDGNYEKTDGSLDGPFNLGYAMSETHGETTTRLVWISTGYFIDDNFLYVGNMNLLLNSLKWMCNLEQNISVIESKSLANSERLEVSAGDGILWNGIFIGVLPLACLITGLAIWVRRKKR